MCGEGCETVQISSDEADTLFLSELTILLFLMKSEMNYVRLCFPLLSKDSLVGRDVSALFRSTLQQSRNEGFSFISPRTSATLFSNFSPSDSLIL